MNKKGMMILSLVAISSITVQASEHCQLRYGTDSIILHKDLDAQNSNGRAEVSLALQASYQNSKGENVHGYRGITPKFRVSDRHLDQAVSLKTGSTNLGVNKKGFLGLVSSSSEARESYNQGQNIQIDYTLYDHDLHLGLRTPEYRGSFIVDGQSIQRPAVISAQGEKSIQETIHSQEVYRDGERFMTLNVRFVNDCTDYKGSN